LLEVATGPKTAAELLTRLKLSGPAIENRELVFAFDPRDDLDPLLRILHTGVRAIFTGSRWFGCGSERAIAAPRLLNPAAPIPRGITLLCVEGDQRWDRIHPAARIEIPHLFEVEKDTTTARPARKS
jgi:hypothetical protein